MATTKVAAKHVETNGSVPSDIEVVDVTPALAQEWLTLNTHNRGLRKYAVQKYATDMTAGDWRWTGESIKFDIDGTLIDGQHRLAAVVLADVTVKSLIVRGLEREAQDNLDQGIPRQFSDVLALRGTLNASLIAAITKRVLLWEEGHRRTFAGSSVMRSTSQLVHAFEAHPEIINVAVRANYVARKVKIAGGLIGHVIWLCDQIDEDDSEFFFDRLADGQNLIKGDPIYELRRTLFEMTNVRTSKSQLVLLVFLIKAWNAYREGRTVSLYRWRVGGANPEPFPKLI